MLVAALGSLSACTSPMPGKPATDIGRMDTTIGHYGQGLDERLLLVTMETGVHARLLRDRPGSAGSPDDTHLPAPFADFIATLRDRHALTRVADWPLDSLGIRCLVFRRDDDRPLADIVAALRELPEVETVQPVQHFSARATNAEPAYDDPYLHLQHGFRDLHVGASHRWATGAGVTVAVIDTGVDTGHTELQHSVNGTSNFVDNDTAAFLADRHGTAVTGIISAATNNTTGMAGIAPDAAVVALKSCWSEPAGSHATCNSYTLAKALNVAIRQHVDIINLSLAGPRDALLERLVATAAARNIIVVGARDPDDTGAFPAVLEEVIAAGLPGDTTATTVRAPGSHVISTAPGNRYDFYTGSSFSTAHLTGVIALLRELDPALTIADIRRLIGASPGTATGTLDACLAVTRLAATHGKLAGAEDCAPADPPGDT